MGKTTKRTTKTSSEASVENGIKVIKTAIRKKLSLSEASRQHNFGRNYVSDIKSRIADSVKNKNVSRSTYNTFKSLLKTYNA